MKPSRVKFSKKIIKENLDLVRLRVDCRGNKLLEETLKRINNNDEIKTLWKIINVNATDRLGYSDHGPTHFQIVSDYAIKIARILEKKEVKMSVVHDFGLTNDHAEVVIFLASIMHDLGMSIHRVNHEMFSLFIARDFLNEILSFLPDEERIVVTSETLHAIISHSHGSAGTTSTVEGGIVRIADALDMTKGRSRISKVLVDIENVSNGAIDKVEVTEGVNRFIDIKIIMSNPAGIFQIDDFVEEKLGSSKLQKYIDVVAILVHNGQEIIFKDYK